MYAPPPAMMGGHLPLAVPFFLCRMHQHSMAQHWVFLCPCFFFLDQQCTYNHLFILALSKKRLHLTSNDELPTNDECLTQLVASKEECMLRLFTSPHELTYELQLFQRYY